MRRVSAPMHLLVIGSETWISDLETKLHQDNNVSFDIEKLTNEYHVRSRLSHNHYDILIVQGGYCKKISDKEIATLGYSMGRPVQVVYDNIVSYIYNKLFVFGTSSLFRKTMVAKEFVTICHKIDELFITRIRILAKIYNEFFKEVIKSVNSNYYKYCPDKSKAKLNVDEIL